MCPNQFLYVLEQHVSRSSTRAGPRSCLLYHHKCSATMMHGMLSMGLRGLQACCLIMMTWCSASLSRGSMSCWAAGEGAYKGRAGCCRGQVQDCPCGRAPGAGMSR